MATNKNSLYNFLPQIAVEGISRSGSLRPAASVILLFCRSSTQGLPCWFHCIFRSTKQRFLILLLSLLLISKFPVNGAKNIRFRTSFYVFHHSITKTCGGLICPTISFLTDFLRKERLHFGITQANSRIIFNLQYERGYSSHCFTYVFCAAIWEN